MKTTTQNMITRLRFTPGTRLFAMNHLRTMERNMAPGGSLCRGRSLPDSLIAQHRILSDRLVSPLEDGRKWLNIRNGKVALMRKEDIEEPPKVRGECIERSIVGNTANAARVVSAPQGLDQVAEIESFQDRQIITALKAIPEMVDMVVAAGLKPHSFLENPYFITDSGYIVNLCGIGEVIEHTFGISLKLLPDDVGTALAQEKARFFKSAGIDGFNVGMVNQVGDRFIAITLRPEYAYGTVFEIVSR